MRFKSVELRPNFVKEERRLLKEWFSSGLVQKYLKKNKTAKKHFAFLDGPITANNPMGVHHAWGRTLKDLFQRYRNMQGFAQRFQNGFDCQGLWVEVEVEKELGFKSKRDIEKFGIARFVNLCKKRVEKYSKVQTNQSKRLGYFMDWDHSYFTMSDENNYMIWHFLKKCWQDGNLYKGNDVVPWCPRCGTAISQHEILTEEYQELVHRSVFFKLPLKDPNQVGLPHKKASLLVWTTTPWTIPANIAVAVNPEFSYVLGKQKESNDYLILIADQSTVDKNPFEKILQNAGIKKFHSLKKIKGKDLVGLYYSGPYDDLPLAKKAKNEKGFHLILASKDLVNAEEGTGIVHISTGTGREDYQLGKEENLPVFPAIDEEGNYLKNFGPLAGKNAAKNPNLIIDDLKKKKFLVNIFPYKHRYPTCWRCKEELLFRLVEEWYLAMDKPKNYREKMVKIAKEIKWIPAFGLKRELDWLKNMEDWLISKKRYWGLALPIWECSCGHFETIGSKEELKKKAVEGWKEFSGHSPHRPWIDKVKILCPQCGKKISRIPDVGNPWLDAGIVSFSTLIDPKSKKVSYLTDQKYWKKWFPADLVTECFPGQFKNWFYSLIAMATVLENKPPFRTLLGHASVRDEKGEEMHKSKGNAIWFDDAAEKMGVDVMRWLYLKNNPVLNVNFGYHIANKTRREFHLLLYNVYRFFVTYANFHRWQPKKTTPKILSPLDRWILARLNQTALIVTRAMDKFDFSNSTKVLGLFVNDLSTWYVRRSRERVMPPITDEKDKEACLTTLHSVLTILSRLLAPFIPFLSEEIYKNLSFGKSVHLTSWPKFKSLKSTDKKLIKEMELARKISELGHAQRKTKKIKVRQPLSKIECSAPVPKPSKIIKLIKDELNVKKIDWRVKKIKEPKVVLETKITKELALEGQAREIIRKIQEERKKSKYNLDQKIIVVLPQWPKKFENFIKEKTLTEKIKKGKSLKIFLHE